MMRELPSLLTIQSDFFKILRTVTSMYKHAYEGVMEIILLLYPLLQIINIVKLDRLTRLCNLLGFYLVFKKI